MRFVLACGLLGLLTACQTAQMSATNPVLAASFPAAKWSSRTTNVASGEITVFTCPEERCGEKIVVKVTKGATPTQSVSLEDILRLRSVDDAFLKEILTVAMQKALAGKGEIRSARKIAKDPVGIFIEGEAPNGKEIFPFVMEIRVRGTRILTATAIARRASTARSYLRLVRTSELLN